MKRLVSLLLVLAVSGCGANTATPVATENTTTSVISSTVSNVQTVTINLWVEGEKQTVEVLEISSDEEVTLLDVMKEHFEIEEENGFVMSINGNSQEPKNNKWWLFDINGKMSEVGAAEAILKAGDSVDWKLDVLE